MKRITILSFLLGLSWIELNAQSFELEIQPSNQQIMIGSEAVYNLSIDSVENFNQQIVFDVYSHNLNIANVSFSFTPQYIEFPYDQNVIFTVTTNGAVEEGDYFIIIEGGNGPTLSKDTCFLSIVSDTCAWVEYDLDQQYTLVGITIDENNNPWVSTNENKLLKFEYNAWVVFDIPNANVKSKIAIDTNNYKWVATDNGLAKFDGNNWIIYNTLNSQIISNDLTSVVVDSNNVVWVGTENSGIVKFDGTYWTVYNSYNTNLVNNNAKKLNIDKNGNLWFINGDYNIAKFTGSDFVIYTPSNSCLSNSTIFSIDFDEDNSLWIAHQDGLIKYNGQEWEEWHKSSINNNHTIKNNNCDILLENNESELTYGACNYIYIDNDNNKWISNRMQCSEPPGEVVKFDDNNWTKFTPQNSTIPDNTAFFIAQSDSSDLWFITLQNSTCYSACDYSVSVKTCDSSIILNTDNIVANLSYFDVYPNPFNDNITIINKSLGSYSIEIYNSLGQIVFTQKSHNTKVVNLSSLSNGMYYISLIFNNNREVMKIIKQ